MSQITVYITTETISIEKVEHDGPCCVAYTSKKFFYIYMIYSVL